MYCQCLMDCLKYETTAQSVNGVKSGADSGGKCRIFRNDKLNGIKCFKKLNHWQKLPQSGKRTCQNDFFDRGVFAGKTARVKMVCSTMLTTPRARSQSVALSFTFAKFAAVISEPSFSMSFLEISPIVRSTCERLPRSASAQRLS